MDWQHRKVCAGLIDPLKNLPVINLRQMQNSLDPNICAINEDSDGMMWVGSTSGGLCRFDRKTGNFYRRVLIWVLRLRDTAVSITAFIKTGQVLYG